MNQEPLHRWPQMRRALELAARGRGWVEPNPMVGCVIEREGRIIGDGWHQEFGGAHAEREALAACGESPAGATAYITLEPCCHTEKKTPPCVPALIEAKLARVVVGCVDPNPEVAGRGIEQLRAAGIEVEVGVLESAARQLNAAFFKRVLHQRPYVTLKWAQTADGKVAGPGGKRMQISNERSMRVVHELRGKCDAIVVGIGTVLSDDPMLTARGERPARRAVRVVLDSGLRIPLEAKVVKTAGADPLRVYCGVGASEEKTAVLRERGVEVVGLSSSREGWPNARNPHPGPLPGGEGEKTPHPALSPEYRGEGEEGREGEEGVPLEAVLEDLALRGATHVMVEAGPTLARAFLGQNLADRMWVFQSNGRVDSPTAPSAPGVDWPVAAEMELDGDRLTEMLNSEKPCVL